MAYPAKRTPARIKKFLETLSAGFSVGEAACAVRIRRETAYVWRHRHPDFAAAWAAAVEDGINRVEDEAFRRGILGFERDAKRPAGPDTTALKYSDKQLAVLLKRRRPEKYGSGRLSRAVRPPAPEMSEEELMRRITFILNTEQPEEPAKE